MLLSVCFAAPQSMMDGRRADREAARLERAAQKEEAEEATAERYAVLLSGMSKEEIDEQVAAEVAVAVVEEEDVEEGEEEAVGGDGGGAFGSGGGFLMPAEQRIGSYVEDSFGNVYYK